MRGLEEWELEQARLDRKEGWILLVTLILVLSCVAAGIWFAFKVQQNRASECALKGGHIVAVGRGNLCVSEDGRIIG